MKYKLGEKITKGARRFLDATCRALFALLCEKQFEAITVGEICDISEYPRATFYNYFDDKYDLLAFFLQLISMHVRRDNTPPRSEKHALDLYFNKLYDLLEEHEGELDRVLTHNSFDGYLFSSCKIYLTSQIDDVFKDIPPEKRHDVPLDLLSEHYASTLLLVLGRRFEKKQITTREETKAYIEYLVKPMG